MSYRNFVLATSAAGHLVVLAAVVFSGGAAVAQTDTVEGEMFVSARTPWGTPDLQGLWSTGYIEIPLERPDEYGDREFLTDDEVSAEQERLSGQQDHSTGGTRPSAPRWSRR